MDQIAELAATLQQYSQDYYRDGSSAVSDAEFDRLEQQLRQLAPDHPYFQKVGAGVVSAGKIEHAVPMLSLDKARDLPELERWQKRLIRSGIVHANSTMLVQPKIDGLSASCCYQDGQLSYVASRGDGSVGQDISHVASYLHDIPPKVSVGGRFEVRGELYLPKDSPFADRKVRSLRNSCVGLINRKEQRHDLRYVRFAAYQCAHSRLARSEGEQMCALTAQGFHTVEVHYANSLAEVDRLFQLYLAEWRRRWSYETDGLVLCLDDSTLFEALDQQWTVNHHHHYAIALKPPSEQGETTLRQVKWQVSRQGALVPVAVFDPIHLSGAKISRASVHHYQNTLQLHLRVGDKLLVARSNDVIPYVLANLSPPPSDGQSAEPSLAPTHCPSCASPLQRRSVHLVCPCPQCPEQVVQRCVYWVKQAEMSQVSEKTIRKLFQEGKIHSVGDLYQLKKEDLQPLKGFADLSVDNLLGQIERSRTSSIIDFLTRLGVPSLQQRAWKDLGALLALRKLTLGLFNRLVQLLPLPEGEDGPLAAAVTSLKESWRADHRQHSLTSLLASSPQLATLLPTYPLVKADQWQQCWQELLAEESLSLPPSMLAECWLNPPPAPLSPKQWRQHCSTALKKSKQQLLGTEVAEQLSLDHFLTPDPGLAHDAVAAANWLEWLSVESNQRLIKEVTGELRLLPPAGTAPKTRPLVALTGEGPAPRQQLVRRLEELGYAYSASLTKSVNILLCRDPKAASSKLKQARKQGIDIVSYDDFFARATP